MESLSAAAEPLLSRAPIRPREILQTMTAVAKEIRTGRAMEMILSTPFLAVLLVALTWPIASPVPSPGPDPSWVAGLYMALGQGIHFGPDFVFAYGPLGFLEQPALYDSELWVVALLFRASIYAALAAALLWSARRALPLVLAIPLVYAVLVVGYLEAAAVLLAFLACVASLSNRSPPPRSYLVPIGGAFLAAIELLAKLNFGITIVGLCLVAILAGDERRRALPLFAGTLTASLLLLWLLARQPAANLVDYAANSLQVLSGYSQAMTADITDVSWQRPFAVLAILLLIGAAILGDASTHKRRLGAAVLAAVFGFAMFKQSFVRQGLGNASDFFPLMLGAALGLAWRLPTRVPRLPSHAPALLLLVPLAVLSVLALPSTSLWRSLEPGDHLEYLRQDLRALADAGERDRLREQGASSMAAGYRLDRKSLALLRQRQVAVDPWEIGAAWAYGLDWKPLPVIQGYQAYTPALDSLNVAALSGPERPSAILRQNPGAFSGSVGSSIDDRYLAWDPPAAALEMLCRYRPVRTTRRWQVLYPAGDRCGPPRLISRLNTSTGEAINVPPPPPHSVVFARVDGLGVEGLESLRSLLYRARERWATLDDGRSWRVVPGTLGDGLVLRSDERIDFPEPFGLAPQARTISFRLAGAEREIEVEFFAQRIFS
jgi:hypothetical protein